MEENEKEELKNILKDLPELISKERVADLLIAFGDGVKKSLRSDVPAIIERAEKKGAEAELEKIKKKWLK